MQVYPAGGKRLSNPLDAMPPSFLTEADLYLEEVSHTEPRRIS